MRDQLFLGSCSAEHYRCGDAFAVNPIGNAETDSFRNGWMSREDFVDFAWRDLFTATINQFLDST